MNLLFFVKQTLFFLNFQLWAAPILAKTNVAFGVWCEQQKSKNAEPDGLTVVFMAHFLNKNITLISGKGEEWTSEEGDATNCDEQIVLVYKGENVYALTNVGTYHSFVFPTSNHINVSTI